MTTQLIVVLRHVLTAAFAALGGALMTRGILTEDQAAALTDPEFIAAAAAFSAAALTAWFEWRSARRRAQ